MDEKQLKELESKLAEIGKSIDTKLADFSTKAKDASVEDLKKLKEEFKVNVKSELEAELKEYNKKNDILQKQVDALETKLQRTPFGNIGANQKTFAEAIKEVLTEQSFKDMVDKKTRRTGELMLKIDDMTQANSFESTLVVEAMRVPGIKYGPDRREHVRDLISVGTTSSNAVTYVQEYAYTDNTDVTSEGAEKKQGDFDLKLVSATVRKISAYLMLSEEMLADVEGLMSYISARLPSRIKLKEDYELLYGDATGIHLSGITKNATAYVDALADADISRIDVLVDAIRQVTTSTGSGLAEYKATAILIHPTDAIKVKLEKDDNGNYIHPWIFMPNGDITLDGVPVFVSTAITAGQFLVGDFKLGAQVFDRKQASIEISYENEDNFVKDMVTVRIFERIALCVYAPKAFIYGTFTAALANGSA
jgi:HK97 family phage major capsid protein